MARLMSSAAALLCASAVVCNASEVPSFGNHVTFQLERTVEGETQTQTLFLDFEQGVSVVQAQSSGLNRVQATKDGLLFQYSTDDSEAGFESPDCRVEPADDVTLASSFTGTNDDGNSVFTLSILGESVEYVQLPDGTPYQLGDWTVVSSSSDFDTAAISTLPSSCFSDPVTLDGHDIEGESVVRLQAVAEKRAELYRAKAELQSGGGSLHPPWDWNTNQVTPAPYMNNGQRWDEPNLIQGEITQYNTLIGQLMGAGGMGMVGAFAVRPAWATQPSWIFWSQLPSPWRTDISGTLLEGTLWAGHGNSFTAWNRLRIEEVSCTWPFILDQTDNGATPGLFQQGVWTAFNSGNGVGGIQVQRTGSNTFNCRVPVANNCNGAPLTYDNSYPVGGITNQIKNTGQQVRWTHTYPLPFAKPADYSSTQAYYEATAFDFDDSGSVQDDPNNFSSLLPTVLQVHIDAQWQGVHYDETPPGYNNFRPKFGPLQARLTKCRANGGNSYDGDYKNPASWTTAQGLTSPSSSWGLNTLTFNSAAALYKGPYHWGDADYAARFHDLSPLAGGAGTNSIYQHCASDSMANKQSWTYPQKLLFIAPALNKCWNLRIQCRSRTWWGACKSRKNGGGFRWQWVLLSQARDDPGEESNKHSGYRFWGPVGAKYTHGKICAAVRLPGEGVIGHPNRSFWSNARIGNGICDDDLNWDFWGFDGGDCCQSTCVWGLTGPAAQRRMCVNAPDKRPNQYYNCCQPGCTGAGSPDGYANGQCSDPNRHNGDPFRITTIDAPKATRSG